VQLQTFRQRDMMEDLTIFYEFLAKGIDSEDIAFFKKSYEALLSQEALQVIHQLVCYLNIFSTSNHIIRSKNIE
jgi:hypothetical protein